ncbi:MAG: tetratricopeptide repeat protein [Methylacidiphilales bacterium]|nr:tetratricopeptide repeat protein [Candidatus Methylacidiphilales bacterium]
MNFTTQAAQDVLAKIEHDPAEVRHWRQLLILCFDQKSIETLQTLQVVVAAIEKIWELKRRLAKEAYEEAKQKQRSTGSNAPLPSSTVYSITLTTRQKETFVKLAKTPQSPSLMYRFGLYLEEEYELPEAALTVYERALCLDPDDPQLEEKIETALKRVKAVTPKSIPAKPDAPVDMGMITPESMGVKSVSHHRPSAAAVIKRTGRLSVDRGRIQVGQNVALTDTTWPETQKKLDETMSRLLTRTASVCETPPRPMRLPRSIAPSQWLEFLEGHVTLLLATLEAQGITVHTTVNLEDAPRTDVAARTNLVMALMEEIELGLAALSSASKAAPTAAKPATPPPPAPVAAATTLEELFEWIDAGSLSEAEAQLRRPETAEQPAEQVSEVWFHLGLAYQNNHGNKLALTAYQKARELNPENLQAWFNGGMIQHEEGMLHPALQSYLRALEIDPQQSKIWCNLGALQFQLGEFQHSVDSLNRAVGMKPDYARAWDNLAGSLCALDQLSEAERCCHRAINFKPDYADPYFKLGTIYFQEGRLEEAEKAFRKVLEVNPGYPLAGHYLAMVLARTHRLEEALEVCHRAATPPGETEVPSLAWNEMAFHLYELGDYRGAIRAYEKAMAFTPEKATIWLDAGVAYQQQGEIDQARRRYEQAVELDPGLARAWHNLGSVRQELGDKKGAEEAFDEAERLLAR